MYQLFTIISFTTSIIGYISVSYQTISVLKFVIEFWTICAIFWHLLYFFKCATICWKCFNVILEICLVVVSAMPAYVSPVSLEVGKSEFWKLLNDIFLYILYIYIYYIYFTKFHKTLKILSARFIFSKCTFLIFTVLRAMCLNTRFFVRSSYYCTNCYILFIFIYLFYLYYTNSCIYNKEIKLNLISYP